MIEFHKWIIQLHIWIVELNNYGVLSPLALSIAV